MILYPTSLAESLDKAAEAFFLHKPFTSSERDEIASFIINRQALSGANAGYFIPFTAEIAPKCMLFTGEQLRTSLARTHILLIESARLLTLLAIENHDAALSIQRADERMRAMCYSNFCSKGECKSLSIAYLRYLASVEKTGNDSRIEDHLSHLSAHRDGKGKWNGFPFYYTLLALIEVNNQQSKQELHYSADICNKLHAAKQAFDPISIRRQVILGRALEKS